MESQSFSLWSIATMFEFLKDSNCVRENSVFQQLISSMMTALTSQAKTAFSLQEFLQQVRRESYVSHLPGPTHPSVKHALLSTPSSSALFSKDVILASLTQVKDGSHLSLLRISLHSRVVGRRPQHPSSRVIVAGMLRLLCPAAVASLNHSAVPSVLPRLLRPGVLRSLLSKFSALVL